MTLSTERAGLCAMRLADLGVLDAVRAILRAYGVGEVDVLGGARHKWSARARRHVWMVLRHSLDLSYPEIGRLFGMDHTTILAGVRLAERELEARMAS